MLKITCISGQWEGRSEEISGGQNALYVLFGLELNRCRWEIDYSQASQDEMRKVAVHDYVMRVIWALQDGRKVFVDDSVYEVSNIEDQSDIKKVAQEVEDHISTSDKSFVLEWDNDTGVKFRLVDPSHN